MDRKIFLSTPYMCGEEQKYINRAFETNWITSLGANVSEFESKMAEYVGVKCALATSTGTSAIHMALRAAGVGEGDVVLCQSMTFCASCNPIVYQNATPVFIDSEPDTWNMSPEALRRALKKYPNAKAVVVVHLYGNPSKMDELLEICSEYGVPLIEDAAEALGSEYKGKMLGSFGKFGILSFNGNKIITTSAGGMLLGEDEESFAQVLKWITQAKEPARWYQHKEMGYNYRMSNVLAGIGLGQMEALDEHIAQKRAVFDRYARAFADLPITMQPSEAHSNPNRWLSAATVDADCGVSPFDIMDRLSEHNVETRPIWKPMHLQPLYEDCDYFAHYENGESVSDSVFSSGICFPSDFIRGMTVEEQDEICSIVREMF